MKIPRPLKPNNNISEWEKKLKELEEVEMPKLQARLGESAPTGDWHENAEYEDAQRQIEILQARINDIKTMIMKMKKGK